MARRGENIRKRKDGRWEGRYTEYEDGVKKMHSVYARTYKEVRKKLMYAKNTAADTILETREKISENNSQISIYQAASHWLNDVKKSKKYATYIKYRDICNKYIFPEIGELTLYHLTSADLIETFPQHASESIQKSIYCVLNQIMVYGNEHYEIPMVHLNKKKVTSKNDPIKILNVSEQKALLRILYQNMDYKKLGICICLSTGLRLGEICALQWKDIDIEAKVLHVNRTVQRIRCEDEKSKTKLIESTPKTLCSKREIPLSEQLCALLKEFQNEEKYVINGNKPMEPRTYQKKLQSYFEKAGISDAHFHTLRHTFATNCIRAGADVKSVSEMLGHSDVRITLNRYVHPSLEMKREHLNSLDSIYGQYLGQVS